MEIKKLTLRNFKGIDEYALTPDGKNITVFGANATGKTTLMDGLTWLLFGKDSLNRADFEIKKLSPTGQPEHGLEHSVEAVFCSNGDAITLKKVFVEKWTKKRGAVKREFTGHTTKHWIDDVPAKKKDYSAKIDEICKEDIFLLLTSPKFFNEQLHWKDRRDLLLEICGDISDADVISSDKALADLPSILGKRALEDHRKVIASRRSEINKEIEKIPTRIDEVSGQKAEVDSSLEEIEEFLAAETQSRDSLISEKQLVEVGALDEVLTTRIREIDNEVARIDNDQAAARLAERKKLDEKIQSLTQNVSNASLAVDNARTGLRRLTMKAEGAETQIKHLEELLENFRKQWFDTDAIKFEINQNDKCPACGQSIPKEQLKSARAKAEEEFNASKAEKLEAINKVGAEKKARLEELKTRRLDIAEATLLAEKEIAESEQYFAEVSGVLDKYKKSIKDVTDAPIPERVALLDEKASVQKQIDEKKGSVVDTIAALDEKIERATGRIREYERLKLRHESNRRIEARIEELKKQERELAAEYEKLEHELYLTDLFVRSKVKLLEDKIASRFKFTRFKLFEEQINEGLNETCIASINGIPYGSMNSAARIQVGVDICQTMAEHFGVSMPIWVDNAESVTDIPPTDAQQIRLVVSPDDKELRVA